jgi:hypothetical protein
MFNIGVFIRNYLDDLAGAEINLIAHFAKLKLCNSSTYAENK